MNIDPATAGFFVVKKRNPPTPPAGGYGEAREVIYMEQRKNFGLQEDSESSHNTALMEVFGADPSVLSEQHKESVDFVLDEGEPMYLLTEYLQR